MAILGFRRDVCSNLFWCVHRSQCERIGKGNSTVTVLLVEVERVCEAMHPSGYAV